MSIRLSVCPIIWLPHGAVVGLLLWAQRAGDINQLLQGWARSGKCKQCQVVS